MNETLYERIKQYQNRQLSELERSAFEQQLQTDPAFAEEVSELATLYQGIQAKGDEELQLQLMDLGKQLLQEAEHAPEMAAQARAHKLAKRFNLPRWAYAVAALFLLLLLALPLYQRLNQAGNSLASAEQLYSEHFQMPAAPTVRDAAVSTWRTAYEQKKYPEAIAALEGLLSDPNYPRPAEAQLFLGLSRMGAGQFQQAINDLQQVSADSSGWDDAQWYLALAYLKQGDTTKAKTLLQNISKQANNTRQKLAENMLTQLR
jgi:hypothetical protein